MKTPLVIARELSEARRVLAEAEVAAAAPTRTGPPGEAPCGPLRVVRQRETAEGVELVVAASVALSGGEDNDCS
jgi:hypothetical protein